MPAPAALCASAPWLPVGQPPSGPRELFRCRRDSAAVPFGLRSSEPSPAAGSLLRQKQPPAGRRRGTIAPQARSRSEPSGAARAATSRPTEEASSHEREMEVEEAEEREEEEEASWVREKVEGVRETFASVGAAVPGPRVGSTGLPWLVAVPLTYLAVSLVWTTVKMWKKNTGPKARRRRQVGKNQQLNEALDEFFPEKRNQLTPRALKGISQQTSFGPPEILRKYIRYVLNEKPFTPETVANLLRLRAAAELPDGDVAEVLNEVSRRVVKQNGPVVMDTTGFTEKGVKRKAAVQAIFSKLLYLSEVEEFIAPSARKLLQITAIFGVTEDDADNIRIESLSDASSLEDLMGGLGDEGTGGADHDDG